MMMGAAVGMEALRSDRAYRETLAREFAVLTPENVMKFRVLRPNREEFAWQEAEELVAFARENQQLVRGHTLIWHHRLPPWLTESAWQRPEVMRIFREHIVRVVSHFAGQVWAWDVVNEAVEEDGSLRNSFWLRMLGEDYVAMAFRHARDTDPDALLFYNDYGGEGLGVKSDAIYGLLEHLLRSGVPIDGVGLQMHVSLSNHPSSVELAENIRRLATLGLWVQITELDVQIQDGEGSIDDRLEKQAQLYRSILDVCLHETRCNAMITWGCSDRYSWIPEYTGHDDAALLFDQDCQPKPAYFALLDRLREGDRL